MKEKIAYWRYLGLSKDTLFSFEERVSKDNLKIVKLESFVIAALCFIASLIMVCLGAGFLIQLILLTAVFGNLVLFFISSSILKNGTNNFICAANRVILLFQLLFYFLAIYIGIMAKRDLAVMIVAAVIMAQISFDVRPVRNLILLCVVLITFSGLTYHYKTPMLAIQDLLNVYFAAIFGYIFMWKKSKARFEHEEMLELVQRNNTILYKNSMTDSLTGLLNRRTAFDRLEVLAAQACVSKRGIVCMILDLDNFKRFNDTYGHPAGDKLLQELGVALIKVTEGKDITVARIGGEEFMIFWGNPEPDSVEVLELTEKIKTSVRELYHPEHSDGMFSTISIGVYMNMAQPEDNASRVYSKADNALYLAKHNGRDRVEFYNNEIEE